jgi:hypothetical protein
MANYEIEIERSNVTVSQFLSYVKSQCEKKGIDFYIEKEDFENPLNGGSFSSYHIIDGKKKCHSAYYATTTKYRRKHASYTTSEGYERYYYTDEFEEYQVTELIHSDYESDGIDAPCKAETCNNLPYDFQTYILNHDGTMYNEICEFTFDDDKHGHGYYYQVNRI